MSYRFLAACVALCVLAVSGLVAQRGKDPVSSAHPAIDYKNAPANDPVAELNRRIQAGQLQLKSDGQTGYLRAVLDALKIPVESQTLVFSETSLQSDFITQGTPRAVYFSDTAAVGWVQSADTLEVAGVDPQQGVNFYQLDQKARGMPHFGRSQRCLECHESNMTQNVPGLTLMSMLPMTDDPNEYAVGWAVDQKTPIEDRWGGWFVTGALTPARHLGNVPVYHVKKAGVRAAVAPKLRDVKASINDAPYLTPYSDVVALLVLNHQVGMTNLLTRLNWTARVEEYENASAAKTGTQPASSMTGRVEATANEVVEYMLLVDEAPLTGKVQGTSGFAEKFTALGPRDGKGRSLRDLDLEKRLLRYPCSYMIYSPAFDALPPRAKKAVYDRLSFVLAGKDHDKAYQRLSTGDRQAIVEILKDTKKDLPPGW